MGNRKYCGNKAGFMRAMHKECATAHEPGWQRMVTLATDAAGKSDINEAVLLDELPAVARGSFIADDAIGPALVEGWYQAVKDSLADGILTVDEETRLQDFRDRFALDTQGNPGRIANAQLQQAVLDRLVLDARVTASATHDGNTHRTELAAMLGESQMSSIERRLLLVQAWEAAVESSLKDGVLSLDEEDALDSYLRHFDLSETDVDVNGAYHKMVKSVVIREAAEGIIPDRLTVTSDVPFNLMKSEQLVWLISGVNYHEVKTRRRRQGTSHGLSIRVAKGLYYRPSAFSNQSVEWEETVHEDTGLLGVTSKHIYFHGPRKRFRVRYDRIVSFEPYRDGIGIMRDAQTAKPQTFQTGDGWFIYDLVTNLAQQS